MPRMRTIKPELWTNDTLAQCSIHARYLFPGLWTQADRRGLLEDRPARLKVALYPYDDVDVDALLNELAEYGFIRRFESNGLKVIHIIKFAQHQWPNRNEKPNNLPEPSGVYDNTVVTPYLNGTSTDSAPSIFGYGKMEDGLLSRENARSKTTTAKREKRKMVPPEWTPSDAGKAYAKEHAVPRAEVAAFVDYHRSKGNTFLDIDAAWRNWCRNYDPSRKPKAERPQLADRQFVKQEVTA